EGPAVRIRLPPPTSPDSSKRAGRPALSGGTGSAAEADKALSKASLPYGGPKVRIPFPPPRSLSHRCLPWLQAQRPRFHRECNPKQLDRFRDRFTVAGAKDDRRDAHVLADSLRTDRHAFRRLSNDEPVIAHA